jgi:hypothetical protein
MKEIETRKKTRFFISDCDFDLVSSKTWYIANNGYPTMGREPILLHRFLMNPPKGFQVDHIDGNKLNNQRENLRIVTPQQNRWNMWKNGGNTSKYKGVSWSKQLSKWVVHICKDRKVKHVGYFDSESEAALAYNECAKLAFGEFARLNIISK